MTSYRDVLLGSFHCARGGDVAAQEELLAEYGPRVRQIVALRRGKPLRAFEGDKDTLDGALLDALVALDEKEIFDYDVISRRLESALTASAAGARPRPRPRPKGRGSERQHARRQRPVDRGPLVEWVWFDELRPAAGVPDDALEARLEEALLELERDAREVIVLRRLCAKTTWWVIGKRLSVTAAAAERRYVLALAELFKRMSFVTLKTGRTWGNAASGCVLKLPPNTKTAFVGRVCRVVALRLGRPLASLARLEPIVDDVLRDFPATSDARRFRLERMDDIDALSRRVESLVVNRLGELETQRGLSGIEDGILRGALWLLKNEVHVDEKCIEEALLELGQEARELITQGMLCGMSYGAMARQRRISNESVFGALLGAYGDLLGILSTRAQVQPAPRLQSEPFTPFDTDQLLSSDPITEPGAHLPPSAPRNLPEQSS